MSCQQRLLSFAKNSTLLRRAVQCDGRIICLLRMGVAFQHALVESFAGGTGRNS